MVRIHDETYVYRPRLNSLAELGRAPGQYTYIHTYILNELAVEIVQSKDSIIQRVSSKDFENPTVIRRHFSRKPLRICAQN